MSDRKKTRKRKKNNVVPLKNNVVPLKSDLQVTSNDNPVDASQAEINRINDHAKEVFNELAEFADGCTVRSNEFWYNILFYAKQTAIMSIPYALFKSNDEGTTTEVTQNFFFQDAHFGRIPIKKGQKIDLSSYRSLEPANGVMFNDII